MRFRARWRNSNFFGVNFCEPEFRTRGMVYDIISACIFIVVELKEDFDVVCDEKTTRATGSNFFDDCCPVNYAFLDLGGIDVRLGDHSTSGVEKVDLTLGLNERQPARRQISRSEQS